MGHRPRFQVVAFWVAGPSSINRYEASTQYVVPQLNTADSKRV